MEALAFPFLLGPDVGGFEDGGPREDFSCSSELAIADDCNEAYRCDHSAFTFRHGSRLLGFPRSFDE